MARPRMVMGLGTAASVQEWPPGPAMLTRKRRLPNPRVTAAAVPEPSSGRTAAMRWA